MLTNLDKRKQREFIIKKKTNENCLNYNLNYRIRKLRSSNLIYEEAVYCHNKNKKKS